MQVDKVIVKRVFKEFTGDSPEITEAIVSHDWDRMLIHRVVKNEE